MSTHAEKIAAALHLGTRQVEHTIQLLEGGATVPFIARSRKEATGGLNEVQIAAIRDALQKLKELDSRREAILESIRKQEKLTPELEQQIAEADNLAQLEDLYQAQNACLYPANNLTHRKSAPPLFRCTGTS